MRRGGGQVEPADRRIGPAQAGNGPEDQLLVECRSSPVDGTADQIRVASLQLARSQNATRNDPLREARGMLLDAVLHPIGKLLSLVSIPDSSEIPTGVIADPLRYMGVGPQGLGTCRGACRIRRRHLTYQQEGAVGNAAAAELGEGGDQFLVGVTD